MYITILNKRPLGINNHMSVLPYVKKMKECEQAHAHTACSNIA